MRPGVTQNTSLVFDYEGDGIYTVELLEFWLQTIDVIITLPIRRTSLSQQTGDNSKGISSGNKSPDYSAEIVGSWRISEGHEWFTIRGESIDFYADGTGNQSFDGRAITDFTWSAGVSLETNYNADVPFKEEMIILRIIYYDKVERFRLQDINNDGSGSILWNSQLFLGLDAGPPVVLVRN